MNRKIILILSVLVLILLPLSMAAAQSSATGRSRGSSSTKINLTVTCNIAGANVSILAGDQKDSPTLTGKTTFTVQLDKGTYPVTVGAPGYVSQTQYFNLQSNQTVHFNLDADKPSLKVNCNVRGATVVIGSPYQNGNVARGTAPFSAVLDKGSYSVTVSAPGYASRTQSINISAATTLNFNLEVENYSLSITSNVADARVQIKGSAINGTINGNTTYSTVLPPGAYKVKVNAPGFYALEKTVQLSGSQSVDFQLQAKTAMLNVVIPNDILNYTVSNPAGQVMIYDNGKKVNGSNIQLNPGQHTIRIVSGGFAAQQTINVRAGETYSFELNFGFTVNKN
jgi:hypothetical protein